MSVMNRKMFVNREARAKLRDMGGIMASFPELMGEVRTYADGGSVNFMGPGFRPERMPGQVPEPLYLPPLPEPTREPEPFVGSYAGFPTNEYPGFTGEGPGRPDWALRVAEQATTGPGSIAGYSMDPRTEEEQQAAALAEEEAQQQAEQERLSASEREARNSEEIYNFDIPQQVADLILPTPEELSAPSTNDNGGGGGGGGGETTTDTLRERALARVALFREIFGDDEPTARDRAMQFAMIGLAIAAGQSPNALTNIAQGLLAGTQAMSEDERRRRERGRELVSAALDSVFQETSLERRAATAEANRARDERRQLESDWRRAYQSALDRFSDPLAGGLRLQAEGISPEEAARREADSIVPGGSTYVDPAVAATVAQAREQGMTDEAIRANLIRNGHNPDRYL